MQLTPYSAARASAHGANAGIDRSVDLHAPEACRVGSLGAREPDGTGVRERRPRVVDDERQIWEATPCDIRPRPIITAVDDDHRRRSSASASRRGSAGCHRWRPRGRRALGSGACRHRTATELHSRALPAQLARSWPNGALVNSLAKSEGCAQSLSRASRVRRCAGGARPASSARSPTTARASRPRRAARSPLPRPGASCRAP